MHLNPWFILIILVVLLSITGIPVSAVQQADLETSGILIRSADLGTGNLSGIVDAVDINAALHTSGLPDSFSLPPSAIIRVEKNQEYSPNAIRPGYEVLYILNGQADISADENMSVVKTGDAVLVPAGSILLVRNTADEPLIFFSAISNSSVSDAGKPGLITRPVHTTIPVIFGNQSDQEYFEVSRLFSTFEELLPLSFDLAEVTIPENHTIGSRNLDNGQLGYILSGTGNLTINCTSLPLSPGDLFFAPPKVIREFSSDTQMTFLVLTSPYYTPESDHLAASDCP